MKYIDADELIKWLENQRKIAIRLSTIEECDLLLALINHIKSMKGIDENIVLND